MVKTISSRSSSRVPEQVDDQGMRDGKGVHTIRDSCYHKKKDAERMGGADGSKHVNGKINYQLQKCTPLGLTSSVTVMYFAPRREGKIGRVQCPWGFSCFIITPPSGRGLVIPVFFVVVTCPRPPLDQNNTCR